MLKIILNLIMGLLEFILGLFLPLLGVPDAPAQVASGFDLMRTWMETAMTFIDWLLPVVHINVCFTIFLVLWTGGHVYDLVLWVLKKIPAAGIE